MTNKEKMLKMVLDNPELTKAYHYNQQDYENLSAALDSSNPVVVAVARIIMDLNGRTDDSAQREVYKKVFTYLNEHCIL